MYRTHNCCKIYAAVLQYSLFLTTYVRYANIFLGFGVHWQGYIWEVCLYLFKPTWYNTSESEGSSWSFLCRVSSPSRPWSKNTSLLHNGVSQGIQSFMFKASQGIFMFKPLIKQQCNWHFQIDLHNVPSSSAENCCGYTNVSASCNDSTV